MKKYLLPIFLLLLLSCGEQKHFTGLSREIEKLEEVEFPCPTTQQPIFKSRNLDLRAKILFSQLQNIKNSKSDEFYIIEKYDYDWGYNYFIHIIIDGKIVGFYKDDFLKLYNEIEVDTYSYKKTIQLLKEKKYDELLKLYSEKGMISTHIFVISKDLNVIHSFVKLDDRMHDI